MGIKDIINEYNNELKTLDDELFSKDFEEKLKKQISIFNKYFSTVSYELMVKDMH